MATIIGSEKKETVYDGEFGRICWTILLDVSRSIFRSVASPES